MVLNNHVIVDCVGSSRTLLSIEKKGIYQLILCDIASAHEDKTTRKSLDPVYSFRPMP